MSKQQTQPVDIFVENALFQHLEVLKRNREKRSKYREIFVEGVAGINALVETGQTVTSISYSREKALSGWAKSIVDAASPPVLYRLSDALMHKLSDRSDPSELIVTAQTPRLTLDDIPLTPDLFAVVFERPSNHGNLGSLVRSCDAFGLDAVITTGHSIDPYDPAVIRASLGAIFHTRLVQAPSSTDFETWLARARDVVPGLQLVGTRAEATLSIFEMTLRPPLILVLGNEAQGMSHRLEELADLSVSIPMQGHVDSLNVACAGAILLYQAKKNMWQVQG